MSSIDFLCVGAEKSGTTWIAEMLRRHPQIFIPSQKELHYFNRKFVEDPSLDNYHFDKPVEWYLSFFRDAKPVQIKGEICPSYLWDEFAPTRIYEFNNKLKIFMILRDPVERTLSGYRFFVQKGIIPGKNLQQDLLRYAPLTLHRSTYFKQVERFVRLFPREQIRVYFFDDLRKDPANFLKNVESFLGVFEWVPEDVNNLVNVTGEPISKTLNRILFYSRRLARHYLPPIAFEWARQIGLADKLEKIRQSNRSRKHPSEKHALDEKTRQWLQEYFRSDIEQLEELLGVDLSAWKK